MYVLYLYLDRQEDLKLIGFFSLRLFNVHTLFDLGTQEELKLIGFFPLSLFSLYYFICYVVKVIN